MNKRWVNSVFLVLLIGFVNTAGFSYYCLLKQAPAGIMDFLISGRGIISLLILMINETAGIILLKLGKVKKGKEKSPEWGNVY